ncbi:MAG: ABC transporter permease [Oscillospiraceae bacterium]|nr:ABC transporter permease [Oscillospiraceae bacterium]MDD4368743.1 ABC transporter permease [Oscillospiraceae bacterium]
MRSIIFAKRNAQEILRDPANVFFGLAFPLLLLFLFAVINRAIPAEAQNTMYEIRNTAPGVAMFGTTFLALFAGTLLAKDRSSAFLLRLFASPLRAPEFIGGYTLPFVGFGILQSLLTFTAAAFMGLPLSGNTLAAMLLLVPAALMFIGIGLICGNLLNDKAVGSICGALLTNLAGWLSGVWIPVDLIGGVFKQVCELLPFYHAAQAASLASQGEYGASLPHFLVLLAYALACYVAAVLLFKRRMQA